jgi:hypothetical protein
MEEYANFIAHKNEKLGSAGNSTACARVSSAAMTAASSSRSHAPRVCRYTTSL